jgi:hypothetical protein
MKRALRVSLVLLFSAATLAFSVPHLLVVAGLFSEELLGIHASGLTGIVRSIDAGSVAARAGLASGDVIDEHDLRTWREYRRVGSTVTFSVHKRDGRIVKVTHHVAFMPEPRWTAIIWVALAGWAVVITTLGAWFALARPGIMSVAFFAYTLRMAQNANSAPAFIHTVDPHFQDAVAALNWLFITAGSMGLITICARFPGDRLPPARRALEVFGWCISPAIASIYFVYITGRFRAHGAYDLFATLAWAIQAVAVAGFVARFASADGGLKQRLRWVGVGLLSVVIGQALYFWDSAIGHSELLGVISIVVNVFPFTFIYALLRERVVDVRFVSARTVMYSALTSLPFILFRGSDSLLRTELTRSRLAVAIEVVLAVALGLFINRLQSRFDRVVERVVLATRYRSEQRVRELLAALPDIDERAAIDAAIVEQCGEAMELASIAVFLSEAGVYRRIASAGWADATADDFGEGDELVQRLRRAPIARLDDDERSGLPAGYARPTAAVPLRIRARLAGFIVVGRHRSGESLDPVESKLLVALGVAAAAAYDNVEVQGLRRENERLHESLRQYNAEPIG